MLKEEEFVLTFLAALNDSEFKPWAHAMSARARLPTFADLTENLRGTFHDKLHAATSASAKSEAYQMLGKPSQVTCDYCDKSRHSILHCFKLKHD